MPVSSGNGLISTNRRNFLTGAALSLTLLSPAGRLLASETSLVNQLLQRINALQTDKRPFRILIPDGSQANLQPLVTLLHQHTSLKAELVVTQLDEITTTLLLAQSDTSAAYDLALPETFALPDLATHQAIVPVTAYQKVHEPAGFTDSMLYTLGDRFGNEFYGYQTDGDAYLMFYNRSFLEDPTYQEIYRSRFGQDLKIPVSWQELDQQMAFFHAPEEGRFGGALFRNPDYLVWEWWARFHARGYLPFSPNFEPQINNAAGVQALKDMIHVTQFLSPGSRSNALFENWAEYRRGNIYANVGWGGTLKNVNAPDSPMRNRMVYSPLPGGDIKGQHIEVPYFNWGWNYTVPVSASHPELSYLVMLLAVSPQVSTESVRQDGYFDPFREEHYLDDGIREIYTPEFLASHHESMMHSIPDLYLKGRREYVQSLKVNLDRAVRGRITPEDALNSTAVVWKSLNLKYGEAKQAEQWLNIYDKYPSRLREVLS